MASVVEVVKKILKNKLFWAYVALLALGAVLVGVGYVHPLMLPLTLLGYLMLSLANVMVVVVGVKVASEVRRAQRQAIPRYT